MIEAHGKHLILKAVFREKESTKILTLKDEKPLYYRVDSVGLNVENVNKGDKVILKNYGLNEFEFGGEKYWLAEEGSIIAKIQM
jgi:co-chaperonin GroES (HSP10)